MSLLSQFFGGTSSRKIKLNVLVVGGGGGSGGVLSFGLSGLDTPGPVVLTQPPTVAISGAGGGGGVGVINNYFIGPGTVCPITVGAAGAAGVGIGSTTLTAGGNGGTSTFQDPTGETFTLIGGGGGSGSWNNPVTTPRYSPSLLNGLPGGCGGGGSRGTMGAPLVGTGGDGSYLTKARIIVIDSVIEPITEGIDIGSGTLHGFPTSREAGPFPGGIPQGYTRAGGGGGGSDVTGPSGNPLLNKYFAPNVNRNGLLNNITGITTSYANGGGLVAYTPTVPSAPFPVSGTPAPFIPVLADAAIAKVNSGNGGVGVQNLVSVSAPDFVYNYSFGGPGIAGAAGVVVVSYPTAFGTSPSFPGASDISPQTPGYRTYQFTSPGSITLP